MKVREITQLIIHLSDTSSLFREIINYERSYQILCIEKTATLHSNYFRYLKEI